MDMKQTMSMDSMKMSYKATPEQLEQLKKDDKIEFEFASQGMNSSIISIRQL